MGDVIRTDRFNRTSQRTRRAMQARFARRRPWQAEHDKAMRDFERIMGTAKKGGPDAE